MMIPNIGIVWAVMLATAAEAIHEDPPARPHEITSERATFVALGAPRETPFHSVALAVSADGSHILGYSRNSTNRQQPAELVVWGPNHTIRSFGSEPFDALGRPGIDLRDFVMAIGSDGSVAVALSIVENGEAPAIWQSESGVRALGNFVEPRIGFIKLSGISPMGDEFFGEVRIVHGDDNPFRNERVTTPSAFLARGRSVTIVPPQKGNFMTRESLRRSPEISQTSRVGLRAVSRSGDVLAGFTETAACFDDAFIWSEKDGFHSLGAPPAPEPSSRPVAVSDNGAGIGHATAARGVQTFVWSAEGGMRALGDLPGGQRGREFWSFPTGIAADGRVAIGWGTTDTPGRTAWLWLGGENLLDLNEFAAQHLGLDLSGWRLNSANAISADGRTIVGFGRNPQRQTEAWVLRIHADPVELAGEFDDS